MVISNNLLCSLGIILVLGINPASCSKGLKGCGKAADDVARNADDVGRHADDIGRNADNVGRNADDVGRAEANNVDNVTKSDNFNYNSDGTYSYRNKQYNNFDDIPFQNTDNIYLERELTPQQAAHLMNRGVKFVYNHPAHLSQGHKQFKIIYLMPDDINAVKELYELDNTNARKLMSYSSEIQNREKIIKVSSYEEMVVEQDQALGNGEIPVLIFHNSAKENDMFRQFDSRSNFITCNSFNVNPASYFTSTDLLDMRAIIEGVNSCYSSSTLEEFYKNFSTVYYDHMSQHHQQLTLVYIGTGAAIGGGTFAIGYYNYNSRT
jgi:hypothetical protein